MAGNAFPSELYMSVQDCKFTNKNGKVPTFQLYAAKIIIKAISVLLTLYYVTRHCRYMLSNPHEFMEFLFCSREN